MDNEGTDVTLSKHSEVKQTGLFKKCGVSAVPQLHD